MPQAFLDLPRYPCAPRSPNDLGEHYKERKRQESDLILGQTPRAIRRRRVIERTCGHASRFAKGLRKAGYAVLNDVVLNQVLVSFGSEDKNRRVLKAVQNDGTAGAARRHGMGRLRCGSACHHGRRQMTMLKEAWPQFCEWRPSVDTNASSPPARRQRGKGGRTLFAKVWEAHRRILIRLRACVAFEVVVLPWPQRSR